MLPPTLATHPVLLPVQREVVEDAEPVGQVHRVTRHQFPAVPVLHASTAWGCPCPSSPEDGPRSNTYVVIESLLVLGQRQARVRDEIGALQSCWWGLPIIRPVPRDVAVAPTACGPTVCAAWCISACGGYASGFCFGWSRPRRSLTHPPGLLPKLLPESLCRAAQLRLGAPQDRHRGSTSSPKHSLSSCLQQQKRGCGGRSPEKLLWAIKQTAHALLHSGTPPAFFRHRGLTKGASLQKE